MSALEKKFDTIRRVVDNYGIAGIMSIMKEKAKSYVRPAIEYGVAAPSALFLIARHGRPEIFVNALGAGIGDDLLLTAVLRELRRRDQQRVWITTRRSELFQNSRDIDVIVEPFPFYDTVLKRLGVKIVYPWYTNYNPAYDRDDPIPEQHLISVMCQKAGITGPVTLRPYLELSERELAAGVKVPLQIAIQSSGLAAKYAMRNKNWSAEGYQRVVSSLRAKYNFVQLGSPDDPPLEGALDLRGKTSLRETAAVLSCSLTFVGQVGLLMHLARAVDCRSVIVYGGRETPGQSGYPCNENLYSPVSCSPCWRLNSCPYDRKCLQMIEAGDVVQGVETQLERRGTPLSCDTSTITQEMIDRNAARYKAALNVHELAWSVLYQ